MMKKIIILLSMLILMTTIAFAEFEPTVTNITYVNDGGLNFGVGADGMSCVGYSDSEMICLGANILKMYNFNKDTLTVTNPYNFTASEWNTNGNSGGFCEFYETDGMAYCFLNENQNIKFDPQIGTVTFLANHTTWTGTSGGNFRCDFRPNTDQVYCWGSSGSPTYLSVYDVSDDMWTYPRTMGYNDVDGEYNYASCGFVDDDNFVCYGGYDGFSNTQSDLIVYDVISNSTTTIATGQKFVSGSAHTIDGLDNIIYFTYGVDDDLGEPLDGIFYYNHSSTTFGTLTATLPVELVLYGSAGTIGNYVYNLGGYAGLGYDNSNDIFELFFDVPVPPTPPTGGLTPYTPTHGIGSVTGLVIDFGVEMGVQYILFAGLIAIIGLGIWGYSIYRKGGF